MLLLAKLGSSPLDGVYDCEGTLAITVVRSRRRLGGKDEAGAAVAGGWRDDEGNSAQGRMSRRRVGGGGGGGCVGFILNKNDVQRLP